MDLESDSRTVLEILLSPFSPLPFSPRNDFPNAFHPKMASARFF
jgi:hypothetical protein